ncbi:VCBS repeat-containing protein [Litoricolaceae bacterium]|nr:VCBS repeat-containing protein [Litorivicinaceae bacterium]
MATVKAIDPLQLRPIVGPAEGLKYYWSFDNQWTASPIVEDFNRDGLEDLIWLQSNYRTGTNSFDQDGQEWPTYPFVYFQSKGDGTFFDNTDVIFPGGQFIGMSASRYVFDDLDGDGFKDLLIIDQGYESIEDDPLTLPDMLVGGSLLDEDGKPWSVEISHQGAVLSWWRGRADGTYERHVISDGYMAFHHNGTAADIDLDGDKELIIANAGTFLSVSDEAIETFLNPTPNEGLLYGGATTIRISDNNILAAGHRPVIPLSLNDSGEFKLDFQVLPSDGMFSIVEQNGNFRELLAVSTIELADLNGDSYPEMIAGVGINYPGAPDFNRIYLNQAGAYSEDSYIPLPFPEVASDLKNRNSAVFIDTADIDGNGLVDIAIGYENPGNGEGAGHFIQVFKQTTPLVFEDVTITSIGTYATIDLQNIASEPYGSEGTWGGGPSYLSFEDLNGDGHPDISMFTQLVGFYELGAAFLINDGTGIFAPIHQSNFSAPGLRNNISYPNQNEYNYQAVYGDFNGDGLKDNLVIEYEFWGYSEDFPNSLRSPASLFTQTELAEEPISRLANGYKIWDKQTQGFNEFYYANHYPDAALAVSRGEYQSLYQFYSVVGKNRGDKAVAPNTKILGTDEVDLIEVSGTLAEFELLTAGSSNGTVIANKSWGNVYLDKIERISFTDTFLALDLDGSAGLTAKTLAAVIGEEGLSNKEYIGIGLQLFDTGQSLAAVCELALAAVGATTNEDVVNLLYTNLYGEAPTAEVAQPFIDALNNNEYSKGILASTAAELTDDLGVIDLVGLAETGIEYV